MFVANSTTHNYTSTPPLAASRRTIVRQLIRSIHKRETANRFGIAFVWPICCNCVQRAAVVICSLHTHTHTGERARCRMLQCYIGRVFACAFVHLCAITTAECSVHSINNVERNQFLVDSCHAWKVNCHTVHNKLIDIFVNFVFEFVCVRCESRGKIRKKG